jgi:predicted nuclease of predicted toxin-antitoxin system
VDHCVPQSVGGVLVTAGHEVIFLRHELAPNSPDPLVAAVAEMNEAVLVSLDGDFQTLAPRAGIGRRRFRRLSRIALKCSEPQAASRIAACLSLIQHEWEYAQLQSDKRMIIEIGNSSIRLIR